MPHFTHIARSWSSRICRCDSGCIWRCSWQMWIGAWSRAVGIPFSCLKSISETWFFFLFFFSKRCFWCSVVFSHLLCWCCWLCSLVYSRWLMLEDHGPSFLLAMFLLHAIWILPSFGESTGIRIVFLMTDQAQGWVPSLASSKKRGHWEERESLEPSQSGVWLAVKSPARCSCWIDRYHLVMTNSLPWKITMPLIGKPSISMGHLYHGYVSHTQRVVMR